MDPDQLASVKPSDLDLQYFQDRIIYLCSTWQGLIRPNKKKISVFWVMGLNILGRVLYCTHIFLYYFFFGGGGGYNFMHFERHFIFQNA